MPKLIINGHVISGGGGSAAPTSQQIISALGYTPYNATNPNGYLSSITSQQVISALGYTPYDTTNPNNYLTDITSAQVSTALGYTPYNATNPNGYLSSISSANVVSALGYTPYNASNPDSYITNSTNGLTNYYTKTQIDGMIGNRFEAQIVSALPTSNISTSTIYMIESTALADTYDEWMYISSTWTKIGSTSIDMSDYAKVNNLHNVAFTGQYASLIGRPTIPTDTSDLTNSAGFITKTVNNLDNYTATSNLAAVATSGSYNDLTNKPTIPTTTNQLTNNSGFISSSQLSSIGVSSFNNDAHYATLNDVSALENLDIDEINRAIAATENIGTVTNVIAGTGLTGGGTTTATLNHSNSVSANIAYPSGTSVANGGSFTVRDVKYDAQGHITSSQDRTITMANIPAYDDTAVRGLISDETTAREALATRVAAEEYMTQNHFSAYVFCIFGIEPYIDPTTLQPVANRYYQRSDVDTGIFMDNKKIDVHLKAWLKYKFGIDTQERLKNITCYVYAMGDHGEYVNHMVTYWSQMTNTDITSYPDLCQIGSFIDDGYGSVHRFTTEQVGAILSSGDDGYISADPLGTGKGYVSGWNTLTGRVSDLEDTIGDIDSLLDTLNGEVI